MLNKPQKSAPKASQREASKKAASKKDGLSPEDVPPPSARSFASGYAAGLNLLSSVLIGVVIGLGLDKWLSTAPLFILIFMFLGMAAGLRSIWFYMKRLDSFNEK